MTAEAAAAPPTGGVWTFLERALEQAGDGPAAAALPEPAGRLRPLAWLLMLHAPVELALYTLTWRGDNVYFGWLFAAGLGLCLVLSFAPGRFQLALRLAVGFLAAAVVWLFPGVSNHFFLVFFCLGLLALLRLERPAEARLALAACRWVAAIVLFYTGLQKVLHGTYFGAQFLVWSIAHSESFAQPFAWILPAAELARIRALPAAPAAEQMYTTDWLPLLAAANLTYLFELAAPVFLMIRRTRAAAAGVTILFLVAIESAAREVLFGIVFVNLVLLFTRRNWNRRLLPVFVALYLVLLAVRLHFLPAWDFN